MRWYWELRRRLSATTRATLVVVVGDTTGMRKLRRVVGAGKRGRWCFFATFTKEHWRVSGRLLQYIIVTLTDQAYRLCVVWV